MHGFKFEQFLTANNVAMVTGDVKKINTICLPMIGHLVFDTIFVAATDNEMTSQ